MRIVVGHANPDFDAYAATVAATKLFEGARGVFLGSQNLNVRAFHNLHEEFLDFVDFRGLDLDAVDEVIMVDTRDPDRLSEFAEVVRRPGVNVVVYDHHPPQEGDIECADDRSVEVGSTTSILVHEIKRRGLELTPLEASLFLLGIHEDTGSLTYPGSTAYDADAAAWLMAVGADIEVLNQFLARSLEPAQQQLLAQLQETMETWDVHGQQVVVGWAEASEYVDSASVLTHYVVEDLGYPVAVAIVRMPERLQVVARSRLAEVDVGAVMTHLGGGGHAQAASAGFRDLSVDEALSRLRVALETEVRRPLTAADVMTAPVRTVTPRATMREAGELMALWGHGGVPVVDDGRLVGLVTRKDVDKAIRHRLDHAPVTGFIGQDLLTIGPAEDLREIERLLASRGVGRLPVLDDGKLVGIVTRKDVLRAEHGDGYLDRGVVRGHPRATESFLGSVQTLLPEEVRATLRRLGETASERGVKAHVVGGFVRDMVLGRVNLDIDVVVEGDGVGFAEAAAGVLGGRVKVHRRFGTAVVVLPDHFHVDVASSRTEYYTKPGALPTVERSNLRQDLFRRDFTINAMSACLDPACFGAIADPFGGLHDLDAGFVRVLHAISFIDDPTRVLRAARFEVRYGFAMDAQTEQLARRSVEMGLLGEVSGARVREELYGLLGEQAPAAVLKRLHALGALAEIVPAGAHAGDLPEAVATVEAAIARLESLSSRPVSRTTALLAAIAASGTASGCERWLNHFRIGREHSEAARALAQRGAGVQRVLEDRRGMRDSRLYRALKPLPAEAIVNLWARGDDLARERVERYVAELSRKRLAVSGHDLIEMGARPDAVFTAILAQVTDDMLDGKAVGRAAELADLRRLATKAGVLPRRKDGV